MQIFFDHLLQISRNIRHHRGNDHLSHLAHMQFRQMKQLRNNQTVLISCLMPITADPPMRQSHISVINADNRISITDIKRDQHYSSSFAVFLIPLSALPKITVKTVAITNSTLACGNAAKAT